MNFVDPIRDEQTIDDIAAYLKKQSERNYIMFMVGVHSGLRISDILRIKIRDVKNKSSLNIIEKKTGKQKNIPIMPRLRKILNEYCKDKDPDDYLIKSRQNYNSPISRDMAYKILSKAGEEHGVFNMGTHSLRKTFGYHFYNQYGDIVMLQQIFNHSHPRITLRYIGMTDESTERAINNFKYKMSYS
ncbi:integrase/recombinase YoeC [Peptoclostridium acidaminophilum DSM 3953]|uniref:Integrase/recombinase YoeC n=1 Tax=Peptoclostridium acidaminophilum DSM 3953 TaxID=1286171 RepID=W8TEY9_PEPAC|nr:site-specific integrase [Peptoclostridium acidaminophilum]AHM56398.1 integrase/recombinase YoeC [Peptoclostridium acidaminophilum DSM 3953]